MKYEWDPDTGMYRRCERGPSQSVFFIVDFEYNTCNGATNIKCAFLK